MIRFPFPTKFVATNRKVFNISVEKPNKRSWWINLLDDDGKVVKTIKVSKTSNKLRYNDDGKIINGPQMLKNILRERTSSNGQTYHKSYGEKVRQT